MQLVQGPTPEPQGPRQPQPWLHISTGCFSETWIQLCYDLGPYNELNPSSSA